MKSPSASDRFPGALEERPFGKRKEVLVCLSLSKAGCEADRARFLFVPGSTVEHCVPAQELGSVSPGATLTKFHQLGG